MSNTEKIYCCKCGEELQDHNAMYDIGNDEYICEDCREAYYMECEDCGRLVLSDNLIAVNNNNQYVCENCASEYYTCDHCGNLFEEWYISINNGQLILCDSCYSNYYFTCEDCGEVYHTDYGEYIGDYLYCESCAEQRRSSILPYSYKPDPIFFGNNANGYYGVELEIDGSEDENRQEAAKAINQAGKNHIYIKEDGSLSYAGMEIVTHPATLDYHVNRFPWSEVCEAALSYGYKSHDTDTCGLHIHASRSLFGSTEIEQDLTIAKIMLLIDRWYNNYILKFARRKLSNMQRWANKPNAGIQPEDNESDAVEKSKKTATCRYKAINLCNHSTVEFRFFKGTLKRDTIIASIQWVDAIICYCRNTSLKDLFNTTWDEIFGNTKHKELTNYLKERNLYNPTLFTMEGEN